MSVNVTQSANLTINGITPVAGAGLTLLASPSLLASNVQQGDYFADTFTVNPMTPATTISLEDIVVGKVLWVQTDNPITITLHQTGGVTAAALTLQDLTYVANILGTAGSSISVAYTTGATAGSEVVTIIGYAISVQIASGVSTALQVKTALEASPAVMALVTVTISGVSTNPQVAAASVNLSGGTVGPISNSFLVDSFLFTNVTFNTISFTNSSASLVTHINLVVAGSRATNPGTPGIY